MKIRAFIIVLLGFIFLNSAGNISESERDALINLYNEFNGDQWNIKSNWKINGLFSPAGTESSWYGVTVKEGKVVEISLPFNNLSGELSNNISGLKNLKKLDLSNNNISGELPFGLTSLTEIETLNLSNNKELSGEIPIYFKDLYHLKQVIISNCNISSIDPYIGDMVSLKEFNISNNAIIDISALTKIATLEKLNVSGNNVSLNSLDFSGMHLLKIFGLSECNLNDTDLNKLTSIPSLEYLYLSNNSISNISPFTTMTSLKSIDLSYNNINQIPSSISGLLNLKEINLSFNSIINLPPEIGALSELRDFIAASNNLAGNIPETIYKLTKLEVLDLSNNEFLSLGNNIKNLINLVELRLGNNKFGNNIIPFIQELDNLKVLELNNNNLTLFSISSNKLINLENLNLSNNNISGNIPTSINSFTKLQIIDFSNNKFSGDIILNFDKFTYLTKLILAGNNFIGDIPSSIGKIRNANYIDLSNNRFNGKIPDEFKDLYFLEYLNLSMNQFDGNIPFVLGNILSLESCNLSGNNFTGNIPLSFKYFNGILDLNYNKLNTKDNTTDYKFDSGWKNTQTVPPEITATILYDNSVTIKWNKINYKSDSGAYIVTYRKRNSTEWSEDYLTTTKDTDSLNITINNPCEIEEIIVKTKTDPHKFNNSTIISEETSTTIDNSITVLKQPESEIQICEGDAISLKISAQAPLIKYHWKKDDKKLESSDSNTLLIENTSENDEGYYYAVISSCNNEMESSACNVKIKRISILQQPQDKLVCPNDNIQFDVITEGENTSYQWFKDNAPITFQNGESLNIDSITPLKEGNYFVRVSSDCGTSKNSDTVKVKLKSNLEYNVNDTTMCTTETITVDAGDGYKFYNWNNDSYDQEYIVTEQGKYGIKVTDDFDCEYTDTITIGPAPIERCLQMSEAFSPNSDGVNDYWKPTEIDEYTGVLVKIYDNNGNIISEFTENDEGWDGTYNSNPVMSNDYWYIIFVDNKKVKQGSVSVVR